MAWLAAELQTSILEAAQSVKIPQKTTSEGTNGEQAWLQDLFSVVHRSPASSSSSSRKRPDHEPKEPLIYTIVNQAPSTRFGGGTGPGTRVTLNALDGEGQQTIEVEVPNYDMNKNGPFKQLSLNGAGRGAFLLSKHCCAVFALPAYQPQQRGRSEVIATTLNPNRRGTNNGEGAASKNEGEGEGKDNKEAMKGDTKPSDARIVKAVWHPLSDAHIGLLFSDNVFMLLNLGLKANVNEPEITFKLTFGTSAGRVPEPASDFCFAASSFLGGGWTHSMLKKPLEAIWLSMTVLFLSEHGRVSFFSPVLPSTCVLPRAAINALRISIERNEKQATTAKSKAPPKTVEQMMGPRELEWLKSTVLNPKNHEEANISTAIGDLTVLRHRAHLHGHREVFEQNWRPREQVLPDEDPHSDYYIRKKARAQLTKYCSLHLMQHMPIAILAKATASGSVEILLAAAALLPLFVPPPSSSPALSPSKKLARRPIVVEEVIVDTAGLQDTVRLSGIPTPDRFQGTLMLSARTRKCITAIAISWSNAMVSGNSDILGKLTEPSSWIVACPKKGSGREIAGWETFRSNRGLAGGLMLCMDPSCEIEPSFQMDDLYQRLLFVAGKAQDPKAPQIASAASSDAGVPGLSRTTSSASLSTPKPQQAPMASAESVTKHLPPVPAFGAPEAATATATQPAASSSSSAAAAATATTATATPAAATAKPLAVPSLSMPPPPPPPSFFEHARPQPISTVHQQSPMAVGAGQNRRQSSRRKAADTQQQLRLREEYARRLTGPIVGISEGEPFYTEEATEHVDACTAALMGTQKSVAAPLLAKQKLLNTLAKTLPGRKALCAREVEDLNFHSQDVATKCQAVSEEVAEVRRRNEELKRRYERIAKIREAKIQIRLNQEARERTERVYNLLQDVTAVLKICETAAAKGIDVDDLLQDQDWLDDFSEDYPSTLAALLAEATPTEETAKAKNVEPKPVPAG